MVRFVYLLTATVILFLLLVPGFAHAATESHGGGGAVPQFDPTYYGAQLFWLVISFIILYVLMARVALPRVGFVVEQRAQKIAQDLEQARHAQAEATGLQRSYETGLAITRNDARETLAQGIAAAQAAQTAALAEQNQALVARVRDAESRIDTAKQAALANIAPAVNALAADAVRKLAGV